ncbi:MAG: PEP-utilizing enzyme [Patescibacteria group bacterium]|nr:PEP-utilizing enzyme [Patescibacteria group bacterium]
MPVRRKTLKISIFKNFVYWAARPISLQGDEWRALLIYKSGIRYLSVPLKGINRCLYLHKVDSEKNYKKILNSALKNYRKHLENYKEGIKIIRLAAKRLRLGLKLSNKRQADLFRQWLEALKNYHDPIIMPFAIEKFLDPEFRLRLIKKYGKDKAREYMDIVSAPTRLNDYQAMRLKMADLIIKKRVNRQNLDKLAKKYYWYSEYSYTEPVLDQKYFKKEIAKMSRAEAIEERNKLLNEPIKNLRAFLKLIKLLENPQLKLMARIMNDYTHIRTERIDEIKKAMAQVRPFYKKLASDLAKKSNRRWQYINAVYLSSEEILSYLGDNIMPDFNKTLERITNNYIYYFDGVPHIISDRTAIKQILRLINKDGVRKKIQGMSAYPGKVSGKVRLILDKKDLTSLKKEEILIAKSTMPDYTPFMKLAGAIITDEGGITCHAAIVSRELGIPCVVGTKIATQVLRDGDKVEVDANKGTVKILKG